MQLPTLNQTCPHCGQRNARQAKFCANCGQPLPTGTRICGVCQTENRGDAAFCKECGTSFNEGAAPTLQTHRWTRNQNAFAVRVEANDLTHLVQRQLKVEPGTRALFVQGGAVQAEVAPGAYTLDTLPQRMREWLTGSVREQVTVLLVDTTPAEFQFHLGGIFTNDPLRIGLTVRLQAEVQDAGKFLINMLKGRDQYTHEDLRTFLYPEVVQIAEHWVSQHSAEDLATDYALREKFELRLEEELRHTFAQSGLRFLQVRTMEYNLEHLDRIKGNLSRTYILDKELESELEMREVELRAQIAREDAELESLVAKGEHALEKEGQLAELDLQREEARQKIEARRDALKVQQETHRHEAEVAAKKRYAHLNQELDLVKLSEETHKVEMEERRMVLYERMRAAVMGDKMSEVRSTAEFEAFLDDIDKQKLLRERERKELLQAWKEGDEDHDASRKYLLAKLNLEREHELRVMAFKQRTDLDRQELDAKQDYERTRLEALWRLEMNRVQEEQKIARTREEGRIALQNVQREADRQQEELDRIAKRTAEIQNALAEAEATKIKAQSQAEVAKINLEMERLEFEQGALMLERMKGIRRKDEYEREINKLEIEHRRHEMESQQAERELALRTREKREQLELDLMRREQERLDQAQTREHELRLRAEDRADKSQDQTFELNRIDKIAQMGTEALIHLSTAEQGRILADLKKHENLKGLTEEQILAAAAENSPQVADVLKEKYRALQAGQANETQVKLYQQLMDAQSQAFDRERTQREQYEKNLAARQDQEIQRMRDETDKERLERERREEGARQERARFLESLDKSVQQTSETAREFARNQPGPASSSPNIIVTPGASSQPVMYTGGGMVAGAGPAGTGPGTNKVCPTCALPVLATAKFCDHCGHAFAGV